MKNRNQENDGITSNFLFNKKKSYFIIFEYQHQWMQNINMTTNTNNKRVKKKEKKKKGQGNEKHMGWGKARRVW